MSGEHRIWVDASYREGIAALVVVDVTDGLPGRVIGERLIDGGVKNSYHAEIAAVRYAKDLIVGRHLSPAVIFTDNQSVLRSGHVGKFPKGIRLEWRSRNSNAAHSRAREILRTVISHPEETSVVPPKKIVRVANDQFPGFADFWKRLDGAA